MCSVAIGMKTFYLCFYVDLLVYLGVIMENYLINFTCWLASKLYRIYQLYIVLNDRCNEKIFIVRCRHLCCHIGMSMFTVVERLKIETSLKYLTAVT